MGIPKGKIEATALHGATLIDAVKNYRRGEAMDRNFEVIFRGTYPRVLSYFRNRGVPEDTCRELARETLWNVHMGLANLGETQTFEAWVHQLAQSHFCRWSRGQASSRRSIDADGAQRPGHGGIGQPTDTGQLTPQARALYHQVLGEALSRLPRKQLTTFLLSEVQGFTHEEVGLILDVAVSAVAATVASVRQHLERAMETARFRGHDDEFAQVIRGYGGDHGRGHRKQPIPTERAI